MAKPQLEDGYTEIANETTEALCRINLSAYESRVVWAIFRKTYGWHKKWDRITFSQFEELTNLDRRHIGRTIRRLTERNIIACRGNGLNIEYSFQKNYDLWDGTPLPNQATENATEPLPVEGKPLPVEGKPLPNQATEALPKEAHTKDKKDNTKETIQKKASLSQKFEVFWKAYPKKKSKGDAEKAFAKVKPDEQLFETILAAIERAKKSAEWLKEGGQFIPYPATWLNRKCWEDEFIEGGQDGTHRGHTEARRLPTSYRSPEEIFGDKGT